MKKIIFYFLMITPLFFGSTLLKSQGCPLSIVCSDDGADQITILIFPPFSPAIASAVFELPGFPSDAQYPYDAETGDYYYFRNITTTCTQSQLDGNITVNFTDGSTVTCTFINGNWDGGYIFDDSACPISAHCNGDIILTQYEDNVMNGAANDPYFYFSLNGPNGEWPEHAATSNPAEGLYSYHVTSSELNCGPIDIGLDVTIYYDNGLQCVYEDGVLCESCPPSGDDSSNDPSCLDWLRTCHRDLISFINEESNLNGCDRWLGACGTSDKIYRNGPVGIGVGINEVPEGYLLAVQDLIMTQQTKISPCNGWCDYVFEKEYELMPLPDVAAFIEKEKHLPGMPSAKTVGEAGGIELGDMTKKQQVKIEEIFLHLIDLEEQLSDLEQSLNRK